MWFRRKQEETYNEQLLREAGLAEEQPHVPDLDEPGPVPDRLPPAVYGGPARAAEWRAHVTAEADGITGDDVQFVTLPAGDVLIETDGVDGDLSPLAEAVERQLGPPYRAFARRQEGSLWFVGANPLDVRPLTCSGDELDLVVHEGERTLTVDGKPSDETVPELAPAGDTAIHAERLDGDLWEIRAEAL